MENFYACIEIFQPTIQYENDICDLYKAKTKAEKVYGMTAEKGYDRKKEDWSL